jgi:hypothetical protein
VCLIFSTTFVWIFLGLRRNERDVIKNVCRSSCKVPVIFVEFLWYLNSRKIFEKYLTIRFLETPSCGGRVVPCRQTNMTILIAVFRNSANAPKKVAVLTELFF